MNKRDHDVSRDTGAARGFLGTVLALAFLAATIFVPLAPGLAPGAELISGLDSGIHFSWESTNRRALSAGQLPHWNPYGFSGYPGLSEIQNQVLYPPNIVLRVLPINQFFAWGIFFHLWLAGAGTFVLCRQIGIGRWASLAAAIGLASCGTVPLKIFAGHIVYLYGFCWTPLVLALTLRSLERDHWLPHPGLVLALVAQFLAGALQVSLYTGACIGAYHLICGLSRAATERPGGRRRVALQAAVLVVLTAGLSSFQLLPTLRLVLESGRRAGVDYAVAAQGALGWSDLFTAFFPYVFGMKHESWEGGLFLGVGLLSFAPLACAARAPRRIVLLLGLMALGSLTLAFGDTLELYRLHHWLLPQFRIPIRLLFFWSLGAAVLSALGIDVVLRRSGDPGEGPSIWAWVPFCVLTSIGALGLIVLSGVGPPLPEATVLGTPLWLSGAGLSTLLSVGLLSRMKAASMIGAVVVALVAVEGVVFTGRMVTLNSPISLDVVNKIAEHQPARVLTLCENVISASDLVRAGIPTTDGFSSIYLGEYARFLTLVRSDTATELTTRLSGRRSLPARLDLLDLLNVTHVVTCDPIDSERFLFVGDVGPTRLYRNTRAKPRAFLTCPVRSWPAGVVAARLHERSYEGGQLVARPPRIEIRWAATLSDGDRAARVRRHSLSNALQVDEVWWAYDLLDQTQANIRALLADEAVDDTWRIDPASARAQPRGAPEMAADPALASSPASGLVGESSCDVDGTVTVQTMDRPDGEVGLVVETSTGGLVYLSEPYYPEREAWLNGVRVGVERVNLAFSAIRVPPGRHVVQLRYVPRAFRWGLSLSTLIGLAWAVILWIERRRRPHPVGSTPDARASNSASPAHGGQAEGG